MLWLPFRTNNSLRSLMRIPPLTGTLWNALRLLISGALVGSGSMFPTTRKIVRPRGTESLYVKTASTQCVSGRIFVGSAADIESQLRTATTLRQFDGRGSATLPVGVATLQYALEKVFLPKSSRSTCQRPHRFGAFQHGGAKMATCINSWKQPTCSQLHARKSFY